MIATGDAVDLLQCQDDMLWKIWIGVIEPDDAIVPECARKPDGVADYLASKFTDRNAAHDASPPNMSSWIGLLRRWTIRGR